MLNNKTLQISLAVIVLLLIVTGFMYLESQKELVEKQRDIYKRAACLDKENLRRVVNQLKPPKLLKDKPEQWEQAKNYLVESCDLANTDKEMDSN